MTTHHIHDSVPVFKGLVADAGAKHLRRMKQAVWLYLYVLLAVNARTGARLVSPALIATEMGLSEETVRSWLGHLRRAGYVRLERQGGFVRVSVKKWRQASVNEATHTASPHKTAPAHHAREVSQADVRLSPRTLALRLGGDPKEPFWEEIVKTTELRQLTEILERVLAVPEEKIKKSRVALFRYLIKQETKQ